MNQLAELYLAGGCFWGMEHFLRQINGVEKTEVGYANGRTPNPTYRQVCDDDTGYAETVHVFYDPQVLSLSLLLELYFKAIDPTSMERQGGDCGNQYRTGIYYVCAEDLPVIETVITTVAKQYVEPIVVEVMELQNFYLAEEFHQDYLINNPTGYCHIDPQLFEMARRANVAPKKVKEPTDK